MKRSIISIALCVALVLTSMCAMFVMPASAANGYDFLVDAGASAQDGVTAEVVDGEYVLTFTAAGQEIAFVLEGESNIIEYPYFEATYVAEMPYDICINDPNNSKWMFGAGDFCYNFVGNQGASSPLAAGAEDVKFSITGAYTWTGAPVPENAAVKQIIFIAKAPGTITISKLAMTDGVADVDLTTESYDPNAAFENVASLLNMDPDAWNNKAVNGSDVTVAVDGDSLVFGTTAGNWPSAYVDFDESYVVPADSVIYADFSVKNATTIYLYLAGSNSQEYSDDEVVTIGGADITVGNYSGSLVLSDIVPAGCIDENGNVSINAISVFAVGEGECVTINAIDLLYNNPVAAEPELYTTFTVESITHEGDIAADEEITFNVTASAAADLANFMFGIAFDDAAFEFVGAEWGSVVADMLAGESVEIVNDGVDAVDGVKTVNFGVMTVAGVDVADNDVIVTITLKAKTDITETAEIAIVNTEAYSADAIINGNTNLYAEGVNGIIEIVAPAYDLGDVEMDGDVDIFDALALFKHVNEETIIEDETALALADTERDGDEDIFDALKLFKFVNEEIDEL